MSQSCPIVLATIAGSSESERLQLVMTPLAEGGSHLELRRQSYAEKVGWYTQSSVQIEPNQVAELRNSLGIGGASGKIRVGAPCQRTARALRIVG